MECLDIYNDALLTGITFHVYANRRNMRIAADRRSKLFRCDERRGLIRRKGQTSTARCISTWAARGDIGGWIVSEIFLNKPDVKERPTDALHEIVHAVDHMLEKLRRTKRIVPYVRWNRYQRKAMWQEHRAHAVENLWRIFVAWKDAGYEMEPVHAILPEIVVHPNYGRYRYPDKRRFVRS